jgi:hypothetical protein
MYLLADPLSVDPLPESRGLKEREDEACNGTFLLRFQAGKIDVLVFRE